MWLELGRVWRGWGRNEEAEAGKGQSPHLKECWLCPVGYSQGVDEIYCLNWDFFESKREMLKITGIKNF